MELEREQTTPQVLLGGRGPISRGPGAIWCLLAGLACTDAKGVQIEQLPSSLKGAPMELEGPQWVRVAPRLLREPETDIPADDPALRRAYGPAEMKVADCTKREADGTIAGAGCPAGCVVFGPYVAVPSNADVRVRFELHAVEKLAFSSDIVSNAKLTHGFLETQTLVAGESRAVGYKVHLTQGVKSLEARLWISSDKTSSFQIKNLTVTVQ